MKLPTIQNILISLKIGLLRFPLAILFAIFASILSIYLIEVQVDIQEHELQKYMYLLHVSILAIPVFIATSILSELKNFKILMKIGIKFIALILLITYFLFLPEHFTEKILYRGFLLTLIIHLLISYLPFLKKSKTIDFWHYNKQLFEKIAITAIYSAVIFIGISVAISIFCLLFSIEINEEIYFQIWIFIVGIFATVFFLANFPKDFNEKQENIQKKEYPLGLKIFTQFVLLPLVTVYLLILYGYLVKIIIAWEIPEGIVSYLVIIFSVLGIFSLLLVYPVQSSEKYKWIKIYSKIFYWAIFPLIFLLFIAIYLRINEYGITENRYFVLILAIWLVGISVFLLINKLKNIKIIPISLSIFAILSVFGPWSAFSISRNSQLRRFENLLIEKNILIDGKINKKNQPIDVETETTLRNQISYVVNNHGYKHFNKYFKNDFDTSFINKKNYEITNSILDSLDISYYASTYDNSETFNFTQNYVNISEVINITDFDYLCILNESVYIENDTTVLKTYNIDDEILTISNYEKYLIFDFKNTEEKLNLANFVEHIYKKNNSYSVYNVEKTDFLFITENKKYSLEIQFENLNGNFNDDEYRVTFIGAKIYIKIK